MHLSRAANFKGNPMKLLVSLSLLCFAVAGFAESTLPAGCQALAVQGETVTIKAKDARLIFIHNITAHDLWITHPVANSGVSAGWTSRLEGGKWSALALDKPPFIIGCIESKPGHEQQIPCEGSIAMCHWPQVSVPDGQQGSFWAAENMSLSALTAAVGGRGFVLPVAK